MARMLYVTNTSIDGYIEDADGSFAWSVPSDDYMAAITDLIRPVGTYVYGRRLYEAMAVWETDPSLAEASELQADFARVWQGADKVVFSTTLTEAPTARARIEPSFDPAAVAELKAGAGADLMVGGADLAAQALRAGLVDDCHVFVAPAVVGRGKPAFPTDLRIDLELVGEQRFANGVVHLHHRIARS